MVFLQQMSRCLFVELISDFLLALTFSFFSIFIFTYSFKAYEERERRNKWVDKCIKANLCWELNSYDFKSTQWTWEFSSFICFSGTIYRDSRVSDMMMTWQMEDFPHHSVLKKNDKSPSPRFMCCSDKIHYDTGNTLTWTVFSGNRPTALISSGQIRKAGRSDFCFSVILQAQILHCIKLFHKLLYLQTFNSEKWTQSPKLEQRLADSAFPGTTVSDHLSRVLVLLVPINVPAHTWESFCSCLPHYRVLAGFPSSVVFPFSLT